LSACVIPKAKRRERERERERRTEKKGGEKIGVFGGKDLTKKEET